MRGSSRTADLCEEVDAGKLQQRGDDEAEAGQQKPVESGGVGHLRQRGPRVDADGGEGQHGRDACGEHGRPSAITAQPVVSVI